MIKLLFSLLLFFVPTFAQAQTVFTKLNTAPITVTNYSDTTAVHNATYQYYVTAVNSAGVESAALATGAMLTVLASITSGPAATAAEIAANTRTLTFNWNESDTGDTFNVYRKLIAAPPVAVAPPTSPTNLTVVVS